MNIVDAISMFAVMLVLAIMPSTSVALVVTRSTTLGVANGVAVALGVVLGDLVFVLLVIMGLSTLAETMGSLFVAIKYMGGAYLLWFGYVLLKTKAKTPIVNDKKKARKSLVASFLAGLFITLGDIKAIFFYLSLFPAFVDLASIKISDIFIITFITLVTVGGVKIAYAFTARKIVANSLKSQDLKLENTSRKIAGSFMIGAGSYLIVKT